MTPVVRFLLIANVAMFIFQTALPRLANLLVFVPFLVLTRPWSVVTYMFLHGGLMHLAFNMLGLWFFGAGVETRIGSRRFVVLYLVSGISGALLSMAFSMGAAVIGASAGVFGVMLAFARFWPDQPIYIWGILPIPARMLVILTTVMAIWSGFGGVGGNVAHFAHLGGYAGAWIYLRLMERRREEFRRRATSAPPEAVKRLVAWQSVDLTKVHEVNRPEVQRILDKIAQHGPASLTPAEALFFSNFVPSDR